MAEVGLFAMLGSAMGPLMLGGMVVGGVASSIVDATKGVNDSCNELQDARNKLKTEQDHWKEVIANLSTSTDDLTLIQQNMVTATSELKLATANYHRIFKNKQQAIDAGIVTFLLGILLMLIIKRIDLWGKILAIF